MRVLRTTPDAPAIHSSGEKIVNWWLGRIYPTPSHVPSDWALVRLTSVARLESGHTPSRNQPKYWSGDIPWISLHDSDRLDGPCVRTTSLTVSEVGIENSSARLLPAGTVVFSRTATVGKATIMATEMSTSQDFANYVCGERLHNRYLMYLFRYMGPEWKRLMAGSTHNTVYMPIFQELQILLPPVAEQEAIAEALGNADAMIESLEQLVAKKRHLKQAAMQQLLPGKIRLPGFEGEWQEPTLEEVSDCFDNLRVPLNESQRARMQGRYPYCGANGVLDYINDYCVDDAVILMAEDGGHFDEFETRPIAYQMSGKIWVNNHAHILKAKKGFDQSFLFYSLVHKDIRRFLASGTRAKLNRGELAKITVSQPVERSEQTAIAKVLSDMDAEITAIEAKLVKTRSIKQGMMQVLLTGRTRLA